MHIYIYIYILHTIPVAAGFHHPSASSHGSQGIQRREADLAGQSVWFLTAIWMVYVIPMGLYEILVGITHSRFHETFEFM